MKILPRDPLLVFVAVALLCQSASGQEAAFDLRSMSLEELLNVEISLTSRTEVKLSETAAAAFVLTGDDIRRAGVTSLPEALRLVPGMQVASIDANKWAISARGFANRFANKLLVLVDGRHVYSPYFAGVFWEVLDVVLEDVERIEVVRGPGATLWGANAVNGIVNIITKDAGDTQGVFAGLTQSLTGKGQSKTARYGGQFAGDGSYRIYGKQFGRDRFFDSEGRGVDDEWKILGGGFRADWKKSRDSFSLQGGLFSNEIEQNLPPARSPRDGDQDALHTGGHVLGHWRRKLSRRSDLSLKGYYDLYERDAGLNNIKSHAYEIDFQHHFAPGAHRELIWGLSYRRTRDEANSGPAPSFERPDADSNLYSAFVHGEATLANGRLRLALGTKLEHNKHTALEYQPSARIIWMPNAHQSLWAAATRAVRTPALSDFRSTWEFPNPPGGPGGPPSGGPGGAPSRGLFDPPESSATADMPDFESEKLRALEAGYRLQPTAALFFDLAVYYNDYARLRLVPFIPPQLIAFPGGPPDSSPGSPPGRPPGPPPGLYEIEPENAVTSGGELVADWRLERGRLRAAYAWVDFDLPQGAPRPAGTESEQRFYLWPSLDLRANLQVDAVLRHADPVGRPKPEGSAAEFASTLTGYTDLDLRLAWWPSRRWEVSLVGQNLLHGHRPEFTGFVLDSQPSEVRRVVYGTLRWMF
jgi:iron complex outermembrane recepter protein